MSLKHILFITTVLLPMGLFAQKAGVEEPKTDYRPKLFGAVKAKFETSLYDGSNRFNVRNSRVGIEGAASANIRYMVQIDFSNEGNLTVLDSYVAYKKGAFEVSLGQQQYHFSTDVTRGPNTNIFANRSFIAKYITSYYGSKLGADGAPSYYVKSIGSRDLGGVAHYSISDVPLRLTFGVYAGTGVNNPEWRNSVNLVGKIDYGGKDGFGIAASHYNGYTPVMDRVVADNMGAFTSENHKQRMRMWDIELRYVAKDLWIQAEYAQRRLRDEGLHILSGAHVQGYYQFRMPKKSDLDYIAPVMRWDFGDNIEFLNKAGNIERVSANRATMGVNFGFLTKIVGAEFRLNFEKYFLDKKPSDYRKNPLLQDKFTIEVVATF